MVMARPQRQPRIRSTDSDGATLSALPNFCSSSVKASVRAPLAWFVFYAVGFYSQFAHFRSRGSSNAPPLPVCIYDWDGLSYRWRDPINSLLFYPDRAYRTHLLVHLYRYCSTYLWCCQGEGYWCSRQGSRWICMGRCKYVGSGRCGSSSG